MALKIVKKKDSMPILLKKYCFRSSGVNRVLIFETNPRSHLNEQDLIQLSAFLGVFWALTFISFIYGGNFFLPVSTTF